MSKDKKKFEYTDKQREAVKDRGNNLLISAAAGSGKTMVLVDRIIDLVLNYEIDIDTFLIVTFTNAAARQMEEKIREKLVDCLGKGKDKFIRKQIQKLRDANISTMHSFCIKLLRTYYEYIGLSPSFSIVNEASEAVIRASAMDMTLGDEYEKSTKDFVDIYKGYSKNGEDDLRNLVDGIHRTIQSEISPMDWLEEAVDTKIDPRMAICDYISEQIEIHLAYSRRALAICQKIDGPWKYEESIEADIRDFTKLLEITRSYDYEGMIDNLNLPSFTKLKSIGKKDFEAGVSEEKKKIVQGLRDKVKKDYNKNILVEFGSKTQNQINKENEIEKAYLKTLTRLVKSYDENLRIIKEEENLLNFSDIEHLTLKLLENKDLAGSIASSISYIFFDEYQDINPLQEEIINRVKSENNLFFVGDIKQSIYSFRLADPKLFNSRYDKYLEGNGGKLINLSDNFRSSPTILKFLNFVFKDLMTKDLGGVDYTKPGQALSWLSDAEDKEGRVNIIVNEKKEDLTYDSIKENPLFVAKEIRRLIDEGYKYEDIVVLMRNMKGRVEEYEKALDAFAIPYYTDMSTVSLDHAEVAIVIDFLKIINNVRNDQALISLLLTPFGKMDEDDLAQIRADNDKGSFYQALIDYDRDDNLGGKIQDFFDLIKKYRKALDHMTIAEFLDYALEDSAYMTYIGAGYLGDERLENIYAFIDRVKDYEAGTYANLPNFLSYVDRLLDSPGDSLEPTKLMTDKDNLVRIMTIHKSKGLEFPIVFMTEMQRNIELQEKSQPIMVDSDLGLGLRVYELDKKISYKTSHRKLMDIKKEKENLSEEVRLFYVGTTRAEKILYLVGNVKYPFDYLENLANKDLDLALKESKSMMDWYLAPAMKDWVFTKDLPWTNPGSYFNKSDSYELRIVDYEDTRSRNEEEIDIGKILKEDYESTNLDKIFSYEYPFNEDTHKAYKTTVSELSAPNFYKTDTTSDFPKAFVVKDEVLDRIPEILIGEEGIGALAKGSLVHYVFQNIRYMDHTIDTIADEIERLISAEILTREESKLLNPEIFLRFFKSDLGQRALNNLPSLEREKAFTMKIGDIYVDGQIDAYFIDSGEIVMYDFKTDKTLDSSRYRDQMAYYKAALEKAYGLKVKETYIYWTSHGRETLI